MSAFVHPSVRRELLEAARPRRTGRVIRVVGLRIEVVGIEAAVGDAVFVHRSTGTVLPTEVVALQSDSLTCMPLGDAARVRYGDEVTTSGRPLPGAVGEELLGRVLDGLGRPIDDGGPLGDCEEVAVEARSPHPLRREMVDRQIALGVRAIDTVIPCGRGQRLGILAGSGVGKSTLLGMIAKGTDADVSVVALVGERGREVQEFITHDLGAARSRSVVVVATSDEPALVRIRAAFTATRIAEWFRDQGAHVVLMADSITRLAMAQREVGLSAGEPPTTRGYPPSMYSLLPKLLERAGAAERGSITGLYTVLVEGDDMNEPIADAARSILDGHIVLSRRLATSGHFPSIDVLESVSRLESAITTREQRALSRELRELLAAYRDAKDLVEIGAYARGSSPVVDRALELKPLIDAFLRQDVSEFCAADAAWAQLRALLTPPDLVDAEVVPIAS
ncbi:MAG: FliI/YscN family ATPase [Acidimicrobiales bacterium]